MYLECAEDASLIDTLLAVIRDKVKRDVDSWIIRYDKWLSHKARQACLAWKIRDPDLWEDLKSELILEAYRIGDRFDPFKGELRTFLVSSLWLHANKPEIIKKYIRERGILSINCSDRDDATYAAVSEETIADSHEISSLERSASVFSLLDQLESHDRDLVKLKYLAGFSNGQLDALSGVGSGVTWYRLDRAIGRIKVCGDGR